MSRPPPHDAYDPVDVSLVPESTWKPVAGRPSSTHTVLYSIGNYYKLVRDQATGVVTYFKLRDTGPEKSPATKLDEEPQKKGQVRYRVGSLAWFVDAGRWFIVVVAARIGEDRATFGEPKRIVIRPTTGRDATGQVEWPYGSELEFPSNPNNPLFLRLRPLKARVR